MSSYSRLTTIPVWGLISRIVQRLTREPIGEGIILLAALTLRMATFTGPSFSDDFAYLEHARDWADGVYDPSRLEYVYGLRYGLVLPVAGAMKSLGNGPWAVTVPSLIASLLGVLSAMLVGKRLANRNVGLLTGTVVATNPASILYGTKVLPEAYLDLSLWLMLAVTLEGAKRRASILFFLAGLVGGYAYIVRSYGLLLAVLGILSMLACRRIWLGDLFPIGFGLIIVPLIEALYHTLSTGDPLWSMHLQAQVYADLANLNNSFLFYPKSLAQPEGELGVLPWAFLITLPFAWMNSGTPVKLGTAWIVLWFCFLEFAIMSWHPLVWIHKEVRYLSILVLPMAFVFSIALQQIWNSKPLWMRLAIIAAYVSILWFDLSYVWYTAGMFNTTMEKYRMVAQVIVKELPSSVAFPHFRWPLRVNYFAGYVDNIRTHAPSREEARFRVPKASDTPRPGEWVVVDTNFFGPGGDWQLPHSSLPAWMEKPPADWQERFTFETVRVVEVPEDNATHSTSAPQQSSFSAVSWSMEGNNVFFTNSPPKTN